MKHHAPCPFRMEGAPGGVRSHLWASYGFLWAQQHIRSHLTLKTHGDLARSPPPSSMCLLGVFYPLRGSPGVLGSLGWVVSHP